MRGSSVHFKRIASAIHAVTHASREVAPEYLLPPDLSLGTFVVIDDHGQVQKTLAHKMQLASRQAKATKDYSPFWEGVINLPDPADATPAQQIEIVQKWCKEYEAMTGHRVLRADVHLDEGFVDEAGKPQFNAHAHVMCDRTDERGKVKKLTSTVLRTVQTMTAEVTTLQRGIDARTTGRKHVGHQNFRFDAEKNRLELDEEKSKTADSNSMLDASNERAKATAVKLKEAKAQAAKVPTLEAQVSQQADEIERLNNAHAAELTRINTEYAIERQALKDSKTATQDNYKELKKERDATVSRLEKELAAALAEAAKVPVLEEKLEKLKEKVETMTQEKAAFDAQLAAEKAQTEKYKAMAKSYNAEKAAGVPAHLITPTPAPAVAAAPAPTRTTTEPFKPIQAPIPAPMPQKPLLERLAASFEAFVQWIQGKGGVVVDLDTQHSDHYGPVVQLGDLHAVQSTGRGKYVVHLLDCLDKVPAMDDSKTEVHYRDGVGQVKGRGVGKGGIGD